MVLADGESIDVACFLAQQAAEKAIKALLASRNLAYPKVHDLESLVERAATEWPELAGWEDRLEALTPYAVELRYGEIPDPSAQEAASALDTAYEFYDLTKRLLDAEPAGAAG